MSAATTGASSADTAGAGSLATRRGVAFRAPEDFAAEDFTAGDFAAGAFTGPADFTGPVELAPWSDFVGRVDVAWADVEWPGLAAWPDGARPIVRLRPPDAEPAAPWEAPGRADVSAAGVAPCSFTGPGAGVAWAGVAWACAASSSGVPASMETPACAPSVRAGRSRESSVSTAALLPAAQARRLAGAYPQFQMRPAAGAQIAMGSSPSCASGFASRNTSAASTRETRRPSASARASMRATRSRASKTERSSRRAR